VWEIAQVRLICWQGVGTNLAAPKHE